MHLASDPILDPFPIHLDWKAMRPSHGRESIGHCILFISSCLKSSRAPLKGMRAPRPSRVLLRAVLVTPIEKRIVMNTIKNRSSRQTADQKLIDGFTKHGAKLATLVIGGTSYKTADVITIMQGLVNSANAVVASRATWQAAVVADSAGRTKEKAFISGVRQSLFVAFGGAIDTLADFGLTPHKARTALTPEEKQAAAAKGKATRAARHTMGRKQKAQIKGTSAPASTTPRTGQ
jgi:hypothetical protein